MTGTVDLEKLRKVIGNTGLKMKFLADKIGVTPGTLSSFLTGKRGLGRAAFQSLLRELDLTEEALKKDAS